MEHDSPTAGRLSFGAVLRVCLIAGLLAGLAASIVLLALTERAINPALAIEEVRTAAEHATAVAGHSHDEELVTRPMQVFGGVVAVTFAGVAFGAIFGVVFAAVRHLLPGRTDFSRAAILAGIGWAIFALFPALKIPANPPAVGDPETIGTRTAIYGGVLLVGVVIALLALRVRSWGIGQGWSQPAVVSAVVATVVIAFAIAMLVLPWNPDTISPDVPPSVVWNFRLASLAQISAMWLTMGLAAGWLLQRTSSTARPVGEVAPVG